MNGKIAEKNMMTYSNHEDSKLDNCCWLIDSGATSHMTSKRDKFYEYLDIRDQEQYVLTAAGDRMKIKGKGTIKITVKHDSGEDKIIRLNNVLHVPELIRNIISMSRITQAGMEIEMSQKICKIIGPEREIIAEKFENYYILVDKIERTKDNNTNYNSEITYPSTEEIVTYPLLPREEPESWTQVNSLPTGERAQWIEAMQDEINKFEEANVWTVAPIPKGQKCISCRWTYKIKYDCNREPACLKARLVARGCFQKFGRDYDMTCAPVVKHHSI